MEVIMDTNYFRDYMIETLENGKFYDDLERLISIYYGLEYILNGMEYEIETEEDQRNFNQLTTCYLTLKKVIERETNQVI